MPKSPETFDSYLVATLYYRFGARKISVCRRGQAIHILFEHEFLHQDIELEVEEFGQLTRQDEYQAVNRIGDIIAHHIQTHAEGE